MWELLGYQITFRFTVSLFIYHAIASPVAQSGSIAFRYLEIAWRQGSVIERLRIRIYPKSLDVPVITSYFGGRGVGRTLRTPNR
jgi:hypothetical protein